MVVLNSSFSRESVVGIKNLVLNYAHQNTQIPVHAHAAAQGTSSKSSLLNNFFPNESLSKVVSSNTFQERLSLMLKPKHDIFNNKRVVSKHQVVNLSSPSTPLQQCVDQAAACKNAKDVKDQCRSPSNHNKQSVAKIVVAKTEGDDTQDNTAYVNKIGSLLEETSYASRPLALFHGISLSTFINFICSDPHVMYRFCFPSTWALTSSVEALMEDYKQYVDSMEEKYTRVNIEKETLQRKAYSENQQAVLLSKVVDEQRRTIEELKQKQEELMSEIYVLKRAVNRLGGEQRSNVNWMQAVSVVAR